VFEISALTRDGCEALVHAVFKQVQIQQATEHTVQIVDPRFDSNAPV